MEPNNSSVLLDCQVCQNSPQNILQLSSLLSNFVEFSTLGSLGKLHAPRRPCTSSCPACAGVPWHKPRHLSKHEGLHPGYYYDELTAEREFTTRRSKTINKWKKAVVLNVASCRRVSHDVCFALCLRLNCNFFLSFTMPKVGGNLHTVINWVTGDLELPHTCRFYYCPTFHALISPPTQGRRGLIYVQHSAAIADREHDG